MRRANCLLAAYRISPIIVTLLL